MSQNKKIISFFLFDMYRGGGERAMLDLMKLFLDKGYTVHLLLTHANGPYISAIDPRVHIVDLHAPRTIATLPRLIRYLQKEKPTALFAISKHQHLISILAKKTARVKTRIILRIGVPFSFDLRRPQNFREFFVPFLVRRLYRYADAIVAVSKGIAYDLTQAVPIPLEKIKVIYTPKNIIGIKNRAQEKVAHSWLSDGETTPCILAIGRLSPQKDFSTLLRAFKKAREQIPAHLLIIGSGEEYEQLLALAKKLSIEKDVEILNQHIDPYPYLARAALFASTSLFEGLPNAHVEALACGAPVISTDCGWGPREILAPQTSYLNRITDTIEYAEYGVLVPIGNEKLLAEGIIKLLTNPELLGGYKEKAQKRAMDFDTSRGGDLYEKLIRN